jgi:hypothetical protein
MLNLPFHLTTATMILAGATSLGLTTQVGTAPRFSPGVSAFGPGLVQHKIPCFHACLNVFFIFIFEES